MIKYPASYVNYILPKIFASIKEVHIIKQVNIIKKYGYKHLDYFIHKFLSIIHRNIISGNSTRYSKLSSKKDMIDIEIWHIIFD